MEFKPRREVAREIRPKRPGLLPDGRRYWPALARSAPPLVFEPDQEGEDRLCEDVPGTELLRGVRDQVQIVREALDNKLKAD